MVLPTQSYPRTKPHCVVQELTSTRSREWSYLCLRKLSGTPCRYTTFWIHYSVEIATNWNTPPFFSRFDCVLSVSCCFILVISEQDWRERFILAQMERESLGSFTQACISIKFTAITCRRDHYNTKPIVTICIRKHCNVKEKLQHKIKKDTLSFAEMILSFASLKRIALGENICWYPVSAHLVQVNVNCTQRGSQFYCKCFHCCDWLTRSSFSCGSQRMAVTQHYLSTHYCARDAT